MPTLALLPFSLVSPPGDYSATGAADEVEALQSDDGGTSYIQVASFPPALELELAMDLLPLAASVTSVNAQVSATGPGTPGEDIRVRASLDGVDGADAINQTAPGSFLAINVTLPRPGGGAWTPAELRRATCIVIGGPNVLISYVTWIVVYVGDVALTGIERAYLTARADWQRAGASRAGFIPTATQGETVTAGLSPGSPGGYYSWRRRYLPMTTWTPVRPPAVDR